MTVVPFETAALADFRRRPTCGEDADSTGGRPAFFERDRVGDFFLAAIRASCHSIVAGVTLLEAMIGNRALTEDAAAQAAPLATSLGVPVVGFDAYLAEWRARRERFSDDAERPRDHWIRFALAPLPGGAYRVRALAPRASIFFEADAYVTRSTYWVESGRWRAPRPGA